MSAIQSDFSASRPLALADTGTSNGPVDDEPMTVAQLAELLCLSQRAEDPAAFEENLTRSEADIRIRRLKRQLEG